MFWIQKSIAMTIVISNNSRDPARISITEKMYNYSEQSLLFVRNKKTGTPYAISTALISIQVTNPLTSQIYDHNEPHSTFACTQYRCHR